MCTSDVSKSLKLIQSCKFPENTGISLDNWKLASDSTLASTINEFSLSVPLILGTVRSNLSLYFDFKVKYLNSNSYIS